MVVWGNWSLLEWQLGGSNSSQHVPCMNNRRRRRRSGGGAGGMQTQQRDGEEDTNKTNKQRKKTTKHVWENKHLKEKVINKKKLSNKTWWHNRGAPGEACEATEQTRTESLVGENTARTQQLKNNKKHFTSVKEVRQILPLALITIVYLLSFCWRCPNVTLK